MATKQKLSDDEIVTLVAEKFPCFGGGRVTFNNPLSAALKDKSPVFAMGVDVKQVVEYVLGLSE